jgi:hypothetical protein
LVGALLQDRPRYSELHPRETERGIRGSENAVNALTGKPTKSVLTGLVVLDRNNLNTMSKYIYTA